MSRLVLWLCLMTSACATTPAASPDAQRKACCAQCAAAGQRDPAGMDISTKDCRGYVRAEFNGGPGVDEACAKYFATTRTTLGACWAEQPG